jgi:2'-5' RNA ligase
MGDVETFLPTTPTVFIQVKRAAYRMRELHDELCVESLNCLEAWPYVPHMTILKTEFDQQALDAAVIARERWAEFAGPRTIRVDELMFVRETNGVWQDVALVPLGRSLLSSRP